jgi:hypothetical protein
MTPARPLLEIEHLGTQDQRRTVSVAGHHQWRESISTARPFDEVDLMLDEHIQIDPFNGDPPSRRKDKELANLLGLLDSLEERGNA